MNNKEIHDLIKLIDKSDIAEVKVEQGDFVITIRTKDFFKGKGQQIVSMPANFTSSAAAPAAATIAPSAVAAPIAAKNAESAPTENEGKNENANHVIFKSPMVGTFYRKPSPDKDVFVKVGDKVSKGDVVCIIEAMKLFNEIEIEVSGTIVKVLLDDQTPVEFDQPLYIIDPA